MKRALIAFLLLAIAGCAPALAPRPFTARQIRDATQNGRTYLFEIVPTDGPAVRRRMLFSDVTEATCTVEAATFEAADGALVRPPASNPYTWAELESHASYPGSRTVIRSEPCPAPFTGEECHLYTVDDSAGVTRIWFAKSLPGAPVRIIAPHMSMTLIQHRENLMSEVNLNDLWDYNEPKKTEEKFRALLPEARTSGNAGYLAELLTQIARTQGLQQQFDEAHATLDEARKLLTDDIPVARVRYLLERGRAFNSNKQQDKAVPLFTEAWELGKKVNADGYAVDAAHMLGIAVKGDGGIEWNITAVKYAETSDAEAARKWLGSLYNNIGWSFAFKDEWATALSWFVKARDWNEKAGKSDMERIARWSIAKAHRKLGKLDEALKMQQTIFDELEKKKESDGFVEEELGEILHALGRLDEAKPHFARAYEVLSKDKWITRDEPERITRLKKLGGL